MTEPSLFNTSSNLNLPTAGAKDFVQQAVNGGAKVAIIAGTCSTPEEKIAEAALEKLGVDSADRCLLNHTPQSLLPAEALTLSIHAVLLGHLYAPSKGVIWGLSCPVVVSSLAQLVHLCCNIRCT